MAKVYRILSIDGGGIRGVIPAKVLEWIEQRTGKATCELFDLIAGTSTGGILAAGLTRPSPMDEGRPMYSAGDMLNLYREEGKVIFGRRARLLQSLYRARFPSEDIERVLERYFQESRLSDALTGLLITSYEIEHRIDFFFNGFRAKEKAEFDFYMRDAARATSAAPVYFQPYIIERKDPPLFVHRLNVSTSEWESKTVSRYALIDGGVFANNPTMCAFVEAQKQIAKNEKLSEDKPKFVVISLSTGRDTGPIRYRDVSGSGYNWVRPSKGVPIMACMFQGSGEVVNFQMRTILNPFDKEDFATFQTQDDLQKAPMGIYLRVEAPLPKHLEAIDDASAQNIKGLEDNADQMITQMECQLEAISHLL